jgi:hypothetical protein
MIRTKESAMLRMIFAGVAAVTIGTVGGLTLVAAMPAKEGAPRSQLASMTSEIVAPSPKKTDPAPVSAPKRTAEAAPTPAIAKAQPAPAPQATPAPASLPIPADLLKEKPEIRFGGDRVSVRLGKYKIEF